MTSARVPCEAIKRYPVVARWRNDVDYVAAGIYCFQPYCVTGELDPPANPLICPQFCVRFNDLDNIGLTGRHYSGFIMLGIQVFNYPDKHVFFKDECVEFNFRWLTEELGIEPDEITFIEDVWAGGGNLGPSIEYFVRGLEVGNMVFMQYKTFHDGSREELAIKIIDTGIGLERIAWLYNGTPTSYVDTFQNALGYLTEKLGVEIQSDIWEKFGPYSCQLNIDEVDDIEATWARLSKEVGVEVAPLKQAITQAKDLYIILDHTRSVLMTITDGSLPANVGGGGNVRNILRRVFSILEKNDWWKKLPMVDFLKVFEMHKKDLEGVIGAFAEYKSFEDIIKVEFDRWKNTDEVQRKNLEKLLKQRKNGILTIDDWIIAMQSWGIPADSISEISKQPTPGNLYYEIAQRQERIAKAPETILYSTVHLPETDNLYYKDHNLTHFDGKIVDVFANILDHGKRNILILDRSAIYPTSGGQQHDTAEVKVEGLDEPFTIVDAVKVGKVVLHILDRELPEWETLKGKTVHVCIDADRRQQLRAHHTGTHIVFASCRKVLGPHVWQNGAKKTIEGAHLDITHFKSITKEEERAIENEANRIINDCHTINKYFMDKAEAEKKFGFHLYQGGIVPGNSLRVVNIEGVDTEACCGTHCDNTAEVGWVRLIKSQRISDGIVRLYYVAHERAISVLNEEHEIL
jgi:alanyl-tRNA synthetase